MKNKYQRAYFRGKYAEIIALLFLMCKGYRPLAWRKKIIFEADLLMRRGNLLLLVEVKYRQNMRDALESITTRKKQRLQYVAQMASKHYARQFISSPDIRIDAVFISPMKIKHLKNIIGF